MSCVTLSKPKIKNIRELYDLYGKTESDLKSSANFNISMNLFLCCSI